MWRSDQHSERRENEKLSIIITYDCVGRYYGSGTLFARRDAATENGTIRTEFNRILRRRAESGRYVDFDVYVTFRINWEGDDEEQYRPATWSTPPIHPVHTYDSHHRTSDRVRGALVGRWASRRPTVQALRFQVIYTLWRGRVVNIGVTARDRSSKSIIIILNC